MKDQRGIKPKVGLSRRDSRSPELNVTYQQDTAHCRTVASARCPYQANLNPPKLRGIKPYRMKLHKTIGCISAIALGLSCYAQISVDSLLDEMVDRERLTRLPEIEYKLLLASSYDRKTTFDSHGTDAWFANKDHGHFYENDSSIGPALREHEHVMMQAQGPGVLLDIWTATHPKNDFRNFTMRIYVDGKREPVIEGNIYEICGHESIVANPFSSTSPDIINDRHPFDKETLYGAHNFRLPIPYSKSCKVVLHDPSGTSNHLFFYNIQYRSYPQGTRVESFTKQSITQNAAKITSTGELLLNSDHSDLAGSQSEGSLDGVIPAGKSKQVTITGAKAIRKLALKLDAEDRRQALRSTVLRINFDGQEDAVWCPLGDFFGAGHSCDPYETWYAKVEQNGSLTCWWVMPFQREATVTITNYGTQDVSLSNSKILTAPYKWDTDRSMTFYAAWKNYPWEDCIARMGEDYNYVRLQGKGRIVGDVLTLWSGLPSRWWGEGDEKIFTDGEAFPSHFGTGCEDYYRYAWGSSRAYSTPWIAQPVGDSNLGYDQDKRPKRETVNLRHRLLDDHPFNTSLVLDMELWAWQTSRINLAPATFWYARPGLQFDARPQISHAQIPVPQVNDDVTNLPVGLSPIRFRTEAESMAAKPRRGKADQQKLNSVGLSNNHQLLWTGAHTGDTLELSFQADYAATVPLHLRAIKAADYGIIDVAVNGQKVASNIDLYHSQGHYSVLIDLGEVALDEGANTLAIGIRGKNAKSSGMTVGLDYLQQYANYDIERYLAARKMQNGQSAATADAFAEAQEFQSLELVNKSDELRSTPQSLGAFKNVWNEGNQVLFLNGKPGSFIEWRIIDANPVAGNLKVYGTKSHDFAQLKFTVNGKPAGKPVDFYAPQPVGSGAIKLGSFMPKDGGYLIRAEIVGKNNKSSGYLFGLDCVVVE